MTETLTRWNIEPLDGDLCARIAERPDGPFVRYEDAAAALTAAHAERDAAQRALNALAASPTCVLRDYESLRRERDTFKRAWETCSQNFASLYEQKAAALRERDALAAQLAQRGETR